MADALKPGMGRPKAGYTRPLGWWYYAKKSVPLFPGVVEARSAAFLKAYYAWRANRQTLYRKLANTITYCGFHAWLPYRSRQIARRYSLTPEWSRTALRIARERFADPNDIALFRISQPEELNTYIRRFEHSEVSKKVNPLCWQPECVLANKIEFYARCIETNLPHPEVFATMVDDRITVHKVPPPGTLAIKPAGGEGGSGFRLGDYAPDGENNEERFLRFLKNNLGSGHLWIVHEKQAVHPDLADIALSALPTARITTLRNEAGEPEIVTSVLRFASLQSSLVDNIKSGGMMAPIELESGRLGMGCRGRGLGDYSNHPVSDAPIEGRKIPDWEAIKDLAIRAHNRSFPEYNLIGWDIAPTDKGPTIIEGNGKPCMIVAQRAPRKGIGETRFGQLIQFHLSRLHSVHQTR